MPAGKEIAGDIWIDLLLIGGEMNDKVQMNEYFETSISLERHPLWWLIKILIEPVVKAYGYSIKENYNEIRGH